ncbi:hypothetical protein PENNAL_c0080G11889 [Penicillium nalgiovense]|uniref:Uncharacterized protein n=1 Tax=Penicillium nalgiovense TaxID=60175 RepID=A0A1V6XGS1_PENNA|nr:hypothetical protein PENNAL_c0080G11889 [Penicillium nalgiovense]
MATSIGRLEGQQGTMYQPTMPNSPSKQNLSATRTKIDNTDLKFGDCNSDGFPRKFLYANGQEIRKRKIERKKVGCSDSPHTVVRLGHGEAMCGQDAVDALVPNPRGLLQPIQ